MDKQDLLLLRKIKIDKGVSLTFLKDKNENFKLNVGFDAWINKIYCFCVRLR